MHCLSEFSWCTAKPGTIHHFTADRKSWRVFRLDSRAHARALTRSGADIIVQRNDLTLMLLNITDDSIRFPSFVQGCICQIFTGGGAEFRLTMTDRATIAGMEVAKLVLWNSLLN